MIDKLKEILCQVESVKKDVMELKTGCEIQYFDDIGHSCSNKWKKDRINLDYDEDDNIYHIVKQCDSTYFIPLSEIKIIGNTLTLKHLMIYCDKKKINLITHGEWFFTLDKGEKLTTTSKLEIVTNYDITKELYEQTDKVLQDIINFLKR